MPNIPECYYRVSVKALVLNDARDKFLICQKDTGYWELPGGGLDWGKTPQEDLPREIDEEMGIAVTKISDFPSYFVSWQSPNNKIWVANIVYETELEHLDFTPSDECIETRFVNKHDLATAEETFYKITAFAEQFDPARH